MNGEEKARFILDLVRDIEVEPIVKAQVLHEFLECRMPFPLWLHHEVTSMFDEGDDYEIRRTDGVKGCFLTLPTVHLVAMRQPTPVGRHIRHTMANALSENGPLSTMSFEEMMAEAARYADEENRLRTILRDVPEGSR